jgi:hypothetical protein
MKKDWLTLKQEQFCKYYMEEKWNATQAYINAYSIKNKSTARTNASRMLTNANILNKIWELLNESWFNDFMIDIELLSLIKQEDNLNIKLRWIMEYNKLRRRYGDRDIYNNTWIIVLPAGDGKSQGPNDFWLNIKEMPTDLLIDRLNALEEHK